jgi:amylosucrase
MRTEHLRAKAALERLLPAVHAELVGVQLPERDADALLTRLRRRWLDVHIALERVYGGGEDLDDLLVRCLRSVIATAADRPEDLRRLDHRREIDRHWYLREDQAGYVCYVDRFAETIPGIADRIDYLCDLGVTYLHLMPLLAPRPGESDGGYAVMDYRAVDPRLGSMDDLEQLAATLRKRGISLCIDLVVNHTAREHEWARKAAAGDRRYRAYYHLFEDRHWPDRYEATLPEVFPDTAPGSFTWSEEAGAWAWTTFHDYQWDLNYANPDVFLELLEVMGFLANRGVEVLRLDAVPFMWKREGTDCQNQPEVHALLQAFRGLVAMAAPALVFKAEAIVPPGELVKYLGAHDEEGTAAPRDLPECELAYNNQLMVMAWSSVAARDGRLATQALSRMRQPPISTSWVTYVRGHDDIGWAVTDEDAAAVGWDGFAHRRFLADFFAGAHPGSFGRGLRFQENPATGDARTSGTTAALCGIAEALDRGDGHLLDQAIKRLLLLYGLAACYGGIPLVYMGDEVALGNDPGWRDVPEQAHDNRWMHRPRMPWEAAARREVPGSVEQRVFAGLRHLLQIRRDTPQLRAGGTTTPMWTANPAVLAFLRAHPRTGRLLVVASFSDHDGSVDAELIQRAGLRDPEELVHPDLPLVDGGQIPLPGLGLRWLASR